MSRSRRKSPYTGLTTADSEKDDKRIVNRILRRVVRQRIAEGEEDIFPDRDEVYDVYKFNKDGKQFIDIRTHAKLMRK